MNWICVALGGALGAMTRFAVFRSWIRILPEYPVFWTTLIVNVIGCFSIGCLFAYSLAQASSENFKLFWIIGFLGGLTTFSTFGLDIFQMIQNKSFLYVATYFLFHGLICVLMVYLGYWIFQLR
jgi:CrcB protein